MKHVSFTAKGSVKIGKSYDLNLDKMSISEAKHGKKKKSILQQRKLEEINHHRRLKEILK
jgi:hypothetical protein